MNDVKAHFFNIYFGLTEIIFYAFLFCTLSFGRAFSTLHLNTFLGPVFVTEIFILLNIPILLNKYKSLTKSPGIFKYIFLIYLTVSSGYLFTGLFKHNMFALRDIVLSLYALFLPVTFVYMNNLRKIKLFIVVIVLSNIISLFSGRCLMLDIYPSETFRNFIMNSKLFNLGLYYGIMSSFIISFYERINSKLFKFLTLIALSLNVFMLVTISLTSLWIAALATSLFLFLIFKVKFLKLLIFFVPIFISISLTIFYLDFKYATVAYNKMNMVNELKGIKLFAFQAPARNKTNVCNFKETDKLVKPSKTNKPAELFSEPKANLINVSVLNEPAEIFSREEVSQKNIDWRLSIWSQTLEFAKGSFWFGKGFGVYPVYKIGTSRQYPQSVYFDPWMVPVHNQFITVFFKMGILGLGLFLFINIYVFIYALSYLKKCNLEFMNNLIIALLGAFVFWQTLAFVFDVIDSPPTSIFLWVVIGLIFAAIEIDKGLKSKVGLLTGQFKLKNEIK